MKTSLFVTSVLVTTFVGSGFAQTEKKEGAEASPAAAVAPAVAPAAATPNEADMMKQMMEMSKLNENHKLLSSFDGNWNYTVKMWMNPDPNAKPQESKGTATRKSIMGGRFVEMDVTGKMQMPGPDGKMKDMTFKGHGLDAYDNVKKK